MRSPVEPVLYRWCVRLLPAPFRERHGRELARTLADQLREKGRAGRAMTVARACMDVLLVAVSVRLPTGRPRGSVVTGAWHDLRFAARGLVRRPASAAIPVLTLMLGIGAATTVFSVVHGVLLRPLPYPAADRIGILWHEFGQGAQNLPALHPLDLYDYRDRSEQFDRFTLATGREWVLGNADAPELVDVGFVEAGFFAFFGAAPALGRTFGPGEDRPDGPRVAILSDRLWRRRFGADPAIVGSLLDLDSDAWRVIGVLPATFRLHLPAEAFRLRDAEIWVPVGIDRTDLPPRNFTGFTGFARLKPGAGAAAGQQELDAMAATLRERHPEHESSSLRARFEPLHDDVVKGARDRLVLLQGAVLFVLLIACGNVANLLLVRGRARAAELSIRAAVGASNARLIRLMLFESLVLAAAGGLAGAALAVGGVEAIARYGPATVPLLDQARVDLPVLLFAVVVSGASALVFGLIPAVQASRQGEAGLPGQPSRIAGSRRQSRVRDVLVVCQVSASLLLLGATGLMIRSFVELTAVNPGFATQGVLTFTLPLSGEAFDDWQYRRSVQEALAERLESLPGVNAVAAISQLPLAGAGPLQPYAFDAETAANWESVTADGRSVTPGFFAAIGATVLAGREFDTHDLDSGANVIVIDERLAERAFPDVSPIGQRLQIEPNGTPEDERFAEVVGVVRHLRLHDVSRPHLTQIYFPGWPGRASFVVRADGDLDALGRSVAHEVSQLVPAAPVDGLRTMASAVDASLAPARFSVALMMGFGGAALLLAGIGLFGVLAQTVSQRTREIGVRMALGQTPQSVRTGVLGHGVRLLTIAIVLGLAGAWLVGRGLSSVLFSVSELDPATWAVSVALLAGCCVVASWIPAVRATRVDPLAALRSD